MYIVKENVEKCIQENRAFASLLKLVSDSFEGNHEIRKQRVSCPFINNTGRATFLNIRHDFHSRKRIFSPRRGSRARVTTASKRFETQTTGH